eukprot:576709-Prymnesium_polylepis.1
MNARPVPSLSPQLAPSSMRTMSSRSLRPQRTRRGTWGWCGDERRSQRACRGAAGTAHVISLQGDGPDPNTACGAH